MEKAGASPEETVLVGDRIYTDIACGRRAGIASILVFSGETTREILLESDIRPDIAIEDVSEITAALRAISGF
jgi:ribonucleotide monophosphatase NagD (HAD superfamily)